MQVCKWPLQGSGQLFHATRPRVTEPPFPAPRAEDVRLDPLGLLRGAPRTS